MDCSIGQTTPSQRRDEFDAKRRTCWPSHFCAIPRRAHISRHGLSRSGAPGLPKPAFFSTTAEQARSFQTPLRYVYSCSAQLTAHYPLTDACFSRGCPPHRPPGPSMRREHEQSDNERLQSCPCYSTIGRHYSAHKALSPKCAPGRQILRQQSANVHDAQPYEFQILQGRCGPASGEECSGESKSCKQMQGYFVDERQRGTAWRHARDPRQSE